MRKVAATLIAACIFLMFSVTAYAEPSITITENGTGEPTGAITAIDLNAEDSDNPHFPIRDIPAGHQHQPIEVETGTEDNVVIIKKTFEAVPGLDPQTLAQPFEQDGYSFAAREILRREAPGETLTRSASQTSTIASETDDMEELILLFPPFIYYEQSGYTGRLYLDFTSLITEADGYETYSHPFTRTREIPGLARNDPALIEREWNGMTLYGLSFRQGTDGRFTATAIYRGMTTGRRPTSYTATVSYHGEVTRTMPGNTLYTVIYEGSPAPASQVPAQTTRPRPPAIATDAEGGLNLLPILLAAVSLFGAAFIVLPRIIPKLKDGKTLSLPKLRKEKSNKNETLNETKKNFRED